LFCTSPTALSARGTAIKTAPEALKREESIDSRLSTRPFRAEEGCGEPTEEKVTASHQLPPLLLKSDWYLNFMSFIRRSMLPKLSPSGNYDQIDFIPSKPLLKLNHFPTQ